MTRLCELDGLQQSTIDGFITTGRLRVGVGVSELLHTEQTMRGR